MGKAPRCSVARNGTAPQRGLRLSPPEAAFKEPLIRQSPHPGESVSEMLDFVPARLRVLRIRRPK